MLQITPEPKANYPPMIGAHIARLTQLGKGRGYSMYYPQIFNSRWLESGGETNL
jgi:hypothetical protein